MAFIACFGGQLKFFWEIFCFLGSFCMTQVVEIAETNDSLLIINNLFNELCFDFSRHLRKVSPKMRRSK